MSGSQPDLFDLYRAGLKNATDLVRASLESAERLQNQQLVAVRRALDEQSASLSELREAKSVDELLALQTRMAGAHFQRAMSLLGELCEAAGENQRAAIHRMQEQLVQVRNWISDSAAARRATSEERSSTA